MKPPNQSTAKNRKIVRGIHRPASVVAVLFAIFTLFRPFCCCAEWNYDWSQRTDRDGRLAGIYTITPFPVNENSASYLVKNDENPTGKTFTIDRNKIVFVDGSIVANCTNYLPLTRACSGGTYHAYTTIAGGIAGTADNTNSTVLVRDGTYTETGLYVKTGVDDTHRWLLCGYNQERPVINGVSVTADTILGNAHSYFTVQRLKIQDNYRDGFFSNAKTSYGNIIDVWLTNNDKRYIDGATKGDGNLYFLGSSYGWIFHCTATNSAGHNFKLGDGGHDTILEWSVASGAGWWDGMNETTSSRSTNIDLPNDAGVTEDRMIVRYNISQTALGYALQGRNLTNFSIHHNEITDAPNNANRPGKYSSMLDGALVLLIGEGANGPCSGSFYSNVFHDPGAVETGVRYYINYPVTLLIAGCQNTSTNVINVNNNLFYDTDTGAGAARGITFSSTNINTTLNLYNNTFWYSGNKGDASGTGYRLPVNIACNPDNCVGFGSGSSARVKNNIFYQGGSGSCVSYAMSGIEHSNNLYFYPKGARGKNINNEIGWIDGMDPKWTLLPSVVYSWGMGNVSDASPAKNAGVALESMFGVDFAGTLRPLGLAWTIGMMEVTGAIQPPTNLRILK